MKKVLFLMLTLVFSIALLTGCGKKKPTTVAPVTTTAEQKKSYNFVIYEKDSNKDDLSDNTVVATYRIEYYASKTKTVEESLIKDGDKYYFVEGGTDYIKLSGGFCTAGYFKDYADCAGNTEIDLSWSYTAVNGTMAEAGMDGVKLKDVTTFGFVIDGWH